MKVLKFGGTSVGTAENINRIISISLDISKDDKIAVVVSAVGGITDELIIAANLASNKDHNYTNTYEDICNKHYNIVETLFAENFDKNEYKFNYNTLIEKLKSYLGDLKNLLDGIFLINELSPKTLDKLLSFGEMLSSTIIYHIIKAQHDKIVLKNTQELIITDSNFNSANVNGGRTVKNIKSYFSDISVNITLLPGFVSKSETGEVTTLGRGGSDYTAAIIAAAINAEELQIWTDVSGMYTANPKVVKGAYAIKKLSYKEALELSHFGAKVLYPPTVVPVLEKNIPVVIKNTLRPEAAGTKIEKDAVTQSDMPVKGISTINDIALLTLQGNVMVGVPGYSKRLFEALASDKINVIFITQSSSEHSICIGITEKDAQRAKEILDKTFQLEISLNKLDPIIVEIDLSIIAVVGDNLKQHQGIAGQMFSILGKNNVNVRAIAQGSSERNISAVINKRDVNKALNSLHEQFFEIKSKQINLYIAGVGNVGKKLLNQIKQQKNYLKENYKIKLRVVGLINSRKMHVDAGGIDLNHWGKKIDDGEKADLNKFFDHCKAFNLRNSVFVDITASELVSKTYSTYLKESVSVVACNKIACSGSYEYYNNLKILARKYNASFLFETNVGAGLPVIDTLNNLIKSGDKVTNIKAVLSGSLNFIFNNYNDKNTFCDTVKLAKKDGYTEPDPRIDLSGVDVARKILILVRESGFKIELSDVTIKNFLTEKASNTKSVDDFLKALDSEEDYYHSLLQSASKNNCKLKYVAEFINGKAKVGLKEIPTDHPFYNLEGKDNIVMFYTERYSEQPMIIKGAGAGADVTASGLFSDIIRISNS